MVSGVQGCRIYSLCLCTGFPSTKLRKELLYSILRGCMLNQSSSLGQKTKQNKQKQRHKVFLRMLQQDCLSTVSYLNWCEISTQVGLVGQTQPSCSRHGAQLEHGDLHFTQGPLVTGPLPSCPLSAGEIFNEVPAQEVPSETVKRQWVKLQTNQ